METKYLIIMDKNPEPPFNYEIVDTNNTQEIADLITKTIKKNSFVEQTKNSFSFTIGKKDFIGRFMKVNVEGDEVFDMNGKKITI